MRLSAKSHWDSKYESKLSEHQGRYFKLPILPLLRTAWGRKLREYMRSYDDYLLWDVLYPEYMPKNRNAKVVEIGSAPGNYLVRLSRSFGLIPYGVEYSESGVELNRQKFISNHIDPDHVIHADFFSEKFHEQYAGYFDIVVSRGFIEHFANTEEVVEKHLNLLARGGYLFVTVPNYRGINYILQSIFNREILALHRLNIMEKERFARLFDRNGLETLHCDYWGTFNFGLFYPKKGSLLRSLHRGCESLQLILNMVFRILFRDKEMKSKFSSPHLIFIGRKKD
jgi:SAM-dependent methyltransferase